MTTRLRTLLGDHAVTRAIRDGRIGSDLVALDIDDVRPPSRAFKRVVRDLAYDVAELAIVTFLVARAHGAPLRLLPATLVARLQHPLLVRAAARPPFGPGDLPGKRVGVRSYSVTTGMWIRGILADDHGVAAGDLAWTTFEDPHVAQFRDPPNVRRAPEGRGIVDMLLDGELDAAIVGPEALGDPRLAPVLRDPDAAAAAWKARTGTVQLNHVVVVRSSLPEALETEVARMLRESFRAAGDPPDLPFGRDAIRRPLEVAIDSCLRQGLVPRRYALEELCR